MGVGQRTGGTREGVGHGIGDARWGWGKSRVVQDGSGATYRWDKVGLGHDMGGARWKWGTVRVTQDGGEAR